MKLRYLCNEGRALRTHTLMELKISNYPQKLRGSDGRELESKGFPSNCGLCSTPLPYDSLRLAKIINAKCEYVLGKHFLLPLEGSRFSQSLGGGADCKGIMDKVWGRTII